MFDLVHGRPRDSPRVPVLLKSPGCAEELLKVVSHGSSQLSRWEAPEGDWERWLCQEHARQTRMSDAEVERFLLARCAGGDGRIFNSSQYSKTTLISIPFIKQAGGENTLLLV